MRSIHPVRALRKWPWIMTLGAGVALGASGCGPTPHASGQTRAPSNDAPPAPVGTTPATPPTPAAPEEPVEPVAKPTPTGPIAITEVRFEGDMPADFRDKLPAGVHVPLTHARVSGRDVYTWSRTPGAEHVALSQLAGRTLDPSCPRHAAAEVMKYYKSRGYLGIFVETPEDELARGILVFRVHLARAAILRVSGAGGADRTVSTEGEGLYEGCPIRVGDYMLRSGVEALSAEMQGRLGCPQRAAVSLEPVPGGVYGRASVAVVVSCGTK